MSTNETNSKATERVTQRLETLEATLLERRQDYNKRRTVYMGVGLVLFALAIISLTSLTRLSSRLDAAAVAQLGRLAVEEHLPDSMQSLKQYLETQSGHVVRKVVESAVDGVPLLRAAVVQNMASRLRVISRELEKRLTEQMAESLGASRAAIDLQGPDLTETERLELLLKEVVNNFRTNSRIVFHEIYPQYVAEIGRVEAFVADLQAKDATELTTKERTQKEMIETLLRIITREKYDPAGALTQG